MKIKYHLLHLLQKLHLGPICAHAIKSKDARRNERMFNDAKHNILHSAAIVCGFASPAWRHGIGFSYAR
jgi:hypothetical protein